MSHEKRRDANATTKHAQCRQRSRQNSFKRRCVGLLLNGPRKPRKKNYVTIEHVVRQKNCCQIRKEEVSAKKCTLTHSILRTWWPWKSTLSHRNNDLFLGAGIASQAKRRLHYWFRKKKKSSCAGMSTEFRLVCCSRSLSSN